ncbi:MAG TPA: polyamine aminopropyltransferase [Thermofilum sp.]|nr:polyamine aminopropyltransferase [Thermofilum sp.]
MSYTPPWAWITEWLSHKEAHLHGVYKVYFFGRTKYQDVAVVETGSFGKALFLDGFVQSTEFDEFVYHEALVHPAMITHPNPEKVAIIGGGEGATLRESLKHQGVKEVTMVDIDRELIDICKRYLPEWNKGAFNDPRTKLVFSDGRRFLKENREKYDVIILDLTDPIKGGPSQYLYTKEFYTIVKERLDDEGVMVTQATNPRYYLEIYATIHNTVKSVFKLARPYRTFIPSFLTDWGFVIGSKGRDPLEVSKEEIERRTGDMESRFYDHEAHFNMFWIPKYMKAIMSRIKRVSTDSSPVGLEKWGL